MYLFSLICDGVHSCLLHAHAWIRLLAAQLLGLYLGKLSDSCQQQLAWFRAGGGDETLKSVILDSFEQLNLADSVSAEMSLQVVKNLVALTKLILARDGKGQTEKVDQVIQCLHAPHFDNLEGKSL